MELLITKLRGACAATRGQPLECCSRRHFPSRDVKYYSSDTRWLSPGDTRTHTVALILASLVLSNDSIRGHPCKFIRYFARQSR